MRRPTGARRARARTSAARGLLLGLALPLLHPVGAGAACRCVCFDGEMRGLCSSPIDPAPVCDRICPLPTTPPGTQARAPVLDNPDLPDPYSDADPVIVGGRGNVAGSAGSGGGLSAGSASGASAR